MLVVGLTGGIGSGKSTVAKLFQELQVPVIEADQITRDLMVKDSPTTNAIVKHFGPEVQNPDQTLNRRFLRQLIFNDEDAKNWLEDLLHPLVRERITQQRARIQAPILIVDIPLLFESRFSYDIDRALVVDCPSSFQIERTCERDQIPPADVQKILKTQASREERLSQADDVITNDKTIAELKKKVRKLHKYYLKLAESSQKLC